MNSKDTPNATFSLESEAGVSRSDSPDGRTMKKSGPAPARVSRFRALDSEKAMPTNDTCGPLFTRSSPSAALQSSLASRLRARMDVNGSPEYVLTWKEQDMPAGVPICQLRASARRTSGNVSSGWPTPATEDSGCSATARQGGENLAVAAQLTGWPTCSARDYKDSPGMSETGINPDGSERSRLDQLPRVANLCGWPTPMAGTPAQNGNNEAGNNDFSRKVTELAGWATPRAEDAESAGMRHSRGTADTLSAQAGQDLKSSPAETASPDASPRLLNPAFSGWLMGYPRVWTLAGFLALSLSARGSKAAPPCSGDSATPSIP